MWAILPSLSALILIQTGSSSATGKFLSLRELRFLGKISYPLYLWHWPLLVFHRLLYSSSLSFGESLSIIGVSVILATLTWMFIERPIQRSKLSLSSGFVLLLSVSALAALCSNEHLLNTRLERQAVLRNYLRYHREWGCFIDGQNSSPIDETLCRSNPKEAPIILWGDSHAAHLFPGMKKFLNTSNLAFQQFNWGGCPPVLDFVSEDAPRCHLFNSYVFKQIKLLKPKEVVLSANWSLYISRPGFLEKFRKTIELLNSYGISHVFLIGQSPTWEKIPSILIGQNYFDQKIPVPQHTWQGVVRGFDHIDQRLLEATHGTNLTYISLYQKLCNQDGCELAFDDNLLTDLVCFDQNHFTQTAAIFLVNSTIGPAMMAALKNP